MVNGDSMSMVGVEPVNAVLVFVSLFPKKYHLPDAQSTDLYGPKPGFVTGLDSVHKSIIVLSSSVTWAYIAPGVYVKGAIQYSSQSLYLRATGFGVLSGQQYVYQPETAQGFQNHKNDTTSLQMWRDVKRHATRNGLSVA
ncbi:Nn.00g105390.m01.CDS01 [Neocucurbitaria sp. VM-36]